MTESSLALTNLTRIEGAAHQPRPRWYGTIARDTEFQLNVDRLGHKRGDENCFFAFADTVVARRFRGGKRSATLDGREVPGQPHDEPSQIVMHVRMLDVEAWPAAGGARDRRGEPAVWAFFQHHEPEQAEREPARRLTTGRIEIDMIQFRGIEFRRVEQPADGG